MSGATSRSWTTKRSTSPSNSLFSPPCGEKVGSKRRGRIRRDFAVSEGTRPIVLVPAVNVLEAEPPLDAQMAVGDVGLQRRGHLDDAVVLDVKPQRAADAAVAADGIRLCLFPFIPRPGLPHVVLALE